MRRTLILRSLLVGSLFLAVVVACRAPSPTPTATPNAIPTAQTTIPSPTITLAATPFRPGTPDHATPVAPATQTPRPTPVPGPVWTLELTITPLELVNDQLRESRAAGPDRLILGMSQKCEGALAIERVGCLGPADFPGLPGLDLFRVYLCHPASYPPMCSQQRLPDGNPLPLLSISVTPRVPVQKWVVEVAPNFQLEQVTFSWDQARLRRQLEGKVNLRIVYGQDIVDIVESTNTYTLVLGPESNRASFLICSQIIGGPSQSRCPLQFP